MDELDELRLKIAKAKGYSIVSDVCMGDYTYYVQDWKTDAVITPGYPTEENAWADAFIRSVPNWTRDIAAAWVLVEEMREAGYPVVVMLVPDDWIKQGIAEAKVYNKKGDELLFFSAPTAPEAICHAWLAWKEANQ